MNIWEFLDKRIKFVEEYVKSADDEGLAMFFIFSSISVGIPLAFGLGYFILRLCGR